MYVFIALRVCSGEGGSGVYGGPSARSTFGWIPLGKAWVDVSRLPLAAIVVIVHAYAIVLTDKKSYIPQLHQTISKPSN
jgi:hypothetical protein